MSSSYTIQQTINWASQFCKLAPLTNVGGFANEPAQTIASTIYQMILGAPFRWRWNRASYSVPVIGAGTVSIVFTPNISFSLIEKIELQVYPPSPTSPVYELQIANALGSDPTATGRPAFASPQYENSQTGALTISFLPATDQSYQLILIGQQAWGPVTVSGTWNPIPDYLGHIYNLGFLGLSMIYSGHPAGPLMFQRFLNTLAGAAEGISEQERSIFLEAYRGVSEANTPQDAQMKLALGAKRFSLQ